jgi:glycosyltransferase involved in cell wall biosynthesis
MRKQPFFSIIIPTYNRTAQLTNCLHSLTLLDYPRNCFEVIVVNDGGETKLEAIADTFRNQINLNLITQPHSGPAAARNTGAAKAKGEFLAFTDDDCIPSPDWLQVLASHFAEMPDYIIGGRTINLLAKNVYSTMSQLIIDVVYRHYIMLNQISLVSSHQTT